MKSGIQDKWFCGRAIRKGVGESMSDLFSPDSEVMWQKKWNEARLFEQEIRDNRTKFYCLEMYPYPSGKMHMGHVRNYSIGDAVARYKRMMGFDVLYPMGFDSFGMPAENAAIKENAHPHEITERNMASITDQSKGWDSRMIGDAKSRVTIHATTDGISGFSPNSWKRA